MTHVEIEKNKKSRSRLADFRVIQATRMSQDMRLQTMWYVRPAKVQTSLRIREV